MTDFGLTLEGFVEKPLETILEEIEDAQRDAFGPDFNTQADSVAGQLNGIFGDKISEVWKAAQAINAARNPDQASGEALDSVSAITGAFRLDAAPSSLTIYPNLAAGTTLPIGSFARIGTTGARWVTLAEVTNPSAFSANIAVEVESESAAPIVGNAFSIDSISVPVAGWVAKAAKNTQNAEPFFLEDGQTLIVEVDLGVAQTVTFNTGDFASIGAATAAEVAAVISSDLSDASAVDAGGEVRVESDLDGTGSALLVTGGSAFESLGFTRELARGMNPDTSAKAASVASEPYALVTAQTLTLKVDREGSTQTITFATDDFAKAATGTITVVSGADLVDGETFVLDDGVNPAVTFEFDDDGSVVESATLRAVNFSAGDSIGAIKLAVHTEITTAPTLDITSVLSATAGVVELTNDNPGTAGNVAITDTVVDAGFLTTGMSGGVASNIGTASAIDVARVINEQISNGYAHELLGAVQIESLSGGNNSYVEVTGGTANAILLFEEEEVAGATGAATLGRDIETDADFRLRRAELLATAGAATIEAIRAAVRAVPGVVQAFVFQNSTDSVDGFGRPPHSVEAVVVGGDDQAIGEALFGVVAGGIGTFKVVGPNGVSVFVVDSQDVTHTINFSRADSIDMHVEIDVTVDPGLFGGGIEAAGVLQIQEAIKELGDLQDIGQDVFIIRFTCAALDVAGVLDVTATKIGVPPPEPPTNTANISIDVRELAEFSTANIDVIVTP